MIPLLLLLLAALTDIAVAAATAAATATTAAADTAAAAACCCLLLLLLRGAARSCQELPGAMSCHELPGTAGSCLELPRAIQNRLKIDPGTLSGRPMVSKSIRTASQECLGSVSGGTRGAPVVPPGIAWRVPKERPGMPGGAPRSTRERFGAA